VTNLLRALCFDAHEPLRLAAFWAGVLHWEQDGSTVVPTDDTGFQLRFLPTQAKKTRPNQVHFDLTSTSLDDQRQTVARALDLGARHIDVGQRPEEGHVVLADPEGNEFCVVGPDNTFLADCGLLGALACDGSQAVGYFWSQALGWPLIWDQDEETAIRAPHGGPKITWGGPPVAVKTGRNRVHFDLAPLPHDDQHQLVERLLSLGAQQVDANADRVAMVDPDGNEFCVLPAGS